MPEVAIKERPILFSAPMVRALLAGTKTQTRRMVKPQLGPQAEWMKDPGGTWYASGLIGDCPADFRPGRLYCPYGSPGDRLWVREAWRAGLEWDDSPPSQIIPARWNETRLDVHYEATPDTKEKPADMGWGRLRPSLFMPRWASRLTLEIVAVRVERVQDITEADAIAEGITDGGCLNCGNHEPCGCASPKPDRRDSFLHTFYDLNKRAPREQNPWVWVVEFRRVTCPKT